MRFHQYHGDNIELSRNRTVASRQASFANGIAFGERPLKPLEPFVVEITQVENGWSGHLRLGLTIIDPNAQPRLPHYALPELNASGQAWIFALTRHTFGAARPDHEPDAHPPIPPLFRVMERDEMHEPTIGRELNFRSPRLPTDVGSRIGVYYEPCRDNTQAIDMRFCINGVQQVAPVVRIQFESHLRRPLYAVVDVYGNTKQVHIVEPLQSVDTLQQLCRSCVLKYVPENCLDTLPLPEQLKSFIMAKNLLYC